MTYKSRTRGNAVLLDSEVLEASKNATGVDPMIALREKHPDAELIFSTREQIDHVRSPFDVHRHLEDFKRGHHDEMTYYGPAEGCLHHLLPIVVSHENMPYIFEGELERWAHMRSTPFVPRVYPHQEESLRHIQTMPYAVMEIDSCKPMDIGIDIHGKVAFDIEARCLQNFRPLFTKPRRGMSGMFDNYTKIMRSHMIIDEAHVWDRNPVRSALAWGLDIRYKFAREDGKTHAQICKQELKAIKKRRKAAMKQLDECGARYEASLKESENVR